MSATKKKYKANFSLEEFSGFFAQTKQRSCQHGLIETSNLDMKTLFEDIEYTELKEEPITCKYCFVNYGLEKGRYWFEFCQVILQKLFPQGEIGSCV